MPIKNYAVELLEDSYDASARSDDYEHLEAISRNLQAGVYVLQSIAASLIALTTSDASGTIASSQGQVRQNANTARH